MVIVMVELMMVECYGVDEDDSVDSDGDEISSSSD